MCKVTVVDENHTYKTCVIIGSETPNGILRHFGYVPEAKIIYMNGTILSKKQMSEPVPKTGNIYLSIHPVITQRA